MGLDTALPQITDRDCRIEDLSVEEYEAADMAAQSWFQSSQFATLYAAATHALVTPSSSGQLIAAFYKMDDYLGMFRKIQFVGPVRLTDKTLRNIMSRHNAQLVNIPLLGHDFLDQGTYDTIRQCKGRLQLQAEDTIIQLPATIEEYISRLGKQTRKHVPYYIRRLEREWGSQLQFAQLANEDIELEEFRRLVDLNRARMSQNWKRSGWTDRMVRNRWLLATNIGQLTGVYRAGQLVAGTICYLYRGDAFLALIAHDPVYDSYNLGTVALYKTIENLIQQQCASLHLLWGRAFYKRQFGGEERPLFHVTAFGPTYGRYCWQTHQVIQAASRKMKTVLRPMLRRSRTFIRGVQRV
jgi:hypothetical protein